eukprot:Polyplicarium_translucidae@DN959_c0_g1_i2.p1
MIPCRVVSCDASGEYVMSNFGDEFRCLTDLGREQARLTGRRLSQILQGKRVAAVYHSNLRRAKETAAEILAHVPTSNVREDSDLAEGVPAHPEPPSSTCAPRAAVVQEDGKRIESAFQKYFFRPEPGEGNETFELVVCHGNVIRYLVCRALQFPPNAWLRWSTHNCGVTWISIDHRGNVSLREFGGVGHMPPTHLTR